MAAEIDIFDTAREGDVSSITEYVRQGGNLNVSNSRGYTPFILATYHGHDEAASALVDAGADACALDEKGSNAYMGVAFKGYLHTAEWLPEHTSCDVNHINGAGQAALMMPSCSAMRRLSSCSSNTALIRRSLIIRALRRKA